MQRSSYFLHVVHWSVYEYGAYLTIAHPIFEASFKIEEHYLDLSLSLMVFKIQAHAGKVYLDLKICA